MASSDEKYHGYDIKIRYEELPYYYQTKFIIMKNNRQSCLLCRADSLMVGGGAELSKEEVQGILYKAGLKKVHELIDSQQFELEKEYIGWVEFDGESWRCVLQTDENSNTQ